MNGEDDTLKALKLIEMADELRTIAELEPRFRAALWFAKDLEGRAGELLRDEASDTEER